MCCCGKPVVNGEMGFRWQPNNAESVYPANPPNLGENDKLLYDEPGRCGGQDSHSYHYRVVTFYGSMILLVKHGGGEERLRLSSTKALENLLAAMDSTSRYWMLNAIYHAHSDGKGEGRREEAIRWRMAAVDKRIKVRKDRGRDSVTVSIV